MAGSGRRTSGNGSSSWVWLMWDNHKLTSHTATYHYYHAFDRSLAPAVLAFRRSRMLSALGTLDLHLRDRAYVRAMPRRWSICRCAGTCSFTVKS